MVNLYSPCQLLTCSTLLHPIMSDFQHTTLSIIWLCWPSFVQATLLYFYPEGNHHHYRLLRFRRQTWMLQDGGTGPDTNVTLIPSLSDFSSFKTHTHTRIDRRVQTRSCQAATEKGHTSYLGIASYTPSHPARPVLHGEG